MSENHSRRHREIYCGSLLRSPLPGPRALPFIVDYKTSRFTQNQDKLLPMYKTQLNSYAVIAERTGLTPVSALGLIYYEPVTDVDTGSINSVVMGNGFNMGFKAHMMRIELNAEEVVVPLLKEVREIGNMEVVPMGREGCEDYRQVEGARHYILQ